jgi:hypothetical protein
MGPKYGMKRAELALEAYRRKCALIFHEGMDEGGI